MKWTLDKKILAGFIACSAVLLIVAIISLSNGEKYTANSKWVNHTHEVLNEFEQILSNSVEIETNGRGYVITGQDNFLDPYLNSKLQLTDHLNKLKVLTGDNPAQQKNIAEIEKLIEARVKHLQAGMDTRKANGFEAAATLITSGEGNRLQNQIRRMIASSKAIEQSLLVQREKESEESALNFNIVFIVLLIVIAMVLIIVYFVINNNLKALRRAEQETAVRNWSLTGTAELTKGMQGNKKVPELSQAVISHLANYLNAQVGVLYILEDATTFRMTGAFAKDDRRKEFNSISMGEGLAGQAAIEKRSILLTDISADTFKIKSGFGEVPPKNIIATPLIFEENVIGVIELGSIYPFTEQQQQYLQLATSNIAIGVIASQARQQTNELLDETQRQSEELRAQQEELQQTNEELHAKTDLLERSEAELKAQQEELQQTNEELEEKANLLEEQKEKLELSRIEVETKARELETTSTYKSEFLANMSHELRTPLNSILILSQLLAENKSRNLSEKDMEFARNINSSGNDLLNLINEILDLSKVEAGKIEIETAPIHMNSVIENLQMNFKELARSRNIDFEIQYHKEHFITPLHTDKQRLEQILRNLLSNAFKFTEKHGKITLEIDVANAQAIFSVTDTGIGIPEDKQAIIFDAFQQADGSTRRKYGGTGLGLSISRKLANVLGGDIYLYSEEGKGSTFTLQLPLQAGALPATQSLEEPISREVIRKKPVALKERGEVMPGKEATDDRYAITENDRVILIIEDDISFSKILLNFSREKGFKGIVANQGNTGLSHARYYRPDAIILDMKLPVMDGSEVLKQLKNDPELRHIPVQVISGFDKRKEGLELGAFDFMKKPLTNEDMNNAFERMQDFINKKLKKLLVVEDNKQQNKAIRELIGNGDVKSFAAYTGEEAYGIMQHEKFDCVIIDLGLPDMSGFELLERIKENDHLNKTPVIVYTGRDMNKEEARRLDKLANTVVLKTTDSKERLLDETTLFLHRVESRLPREKQQIIRKLHRTEEVLKNRKVLIVDDDMRNTYSLTNVLEEEHMQCYTADTGKAALKVLEQQPGIEIILMDVMMPEMDGYEATQEIRKLNEYIKIPIIALTAKAMKGDREKCLEAGMSDYISKPVNVEQLLSLMRVWLYR